MTVIPGCDAAWTRRQTPTFQRNVLLYQCFTETRLSTYESTWRYNPEYRHLHRHDNFTILNTNKVPLSLITNVYSYHRHRYNRFIALVQFTCTFGIFSYPEGYIFTIVILNEQFNSPSAVYFQKHMDE